METEVINFISSFKLNDLTNRNKNKLIYDFENVIQMLEKQKTRCSVGCEIEMLQK